MSVRKKKLFGAFIIIIFATLLFLLYEVFYGQYHKTTDDAYIKGNVTPISSRIPGYIKEVNVSDNEFVLQGTILFDLDDRNLKLVLDNATSKIHEQKNKLLSLEKKITVDHYRIDQVKANVKASEAKLAQSKKNYQRLLDLSKKDYTSVAKLDAAVAQNEIIKAELESGEAQLQIAINALSITEINIEQAKSALYQAETAFKQAKLQLTFTKITAPFDGVVTNRVAKVGMFVNQGMPVLSIVPLKDLWVEANFKETQIAFIRKNQPVKISIDAYPGAKLFGKIDSITPSTQGQFALLPPQNASGNFTKIVQRIPVKIALLKTQKFKGRLYPGLSAEVDVNIK